MKNIIKKIFVIFFAITLSARSITFASSNSALEKAIGNAAEYILNTVKNPAFGVIGGEWAIIGLARSGYSLPDSYFASYYKAVEQYTRSSKGVLHENKYTEYSRIILSLTAAGYDPRSVAGYDLLLPLGDFEKTLLQGINGPIWALIALDSLDYSIPATANRQATRELYVEEILRRQSLSGGWSLAGEGGDPDITGMALQALAKYQDRPDVKTATNKALVFLSNIQDAKGGYASWGDANLESVVQVLVALCELGISVHDNRFVKDGNTLIDNILSFRNSNGGFNHTAGGNDHSQMASEQALYGLVAAKRVAEGKSSLYRMSDVLRPADFAAAEADGLPNKHTDVKKMEIILPRRSFADVSGHPNRQAIEALAERGIISGKSETFFDPDATMTRAEFAAIITCGLGLPDKNVTVFTDVPTSAWFATAVGTAYYYAIVSGASAETFNPMGTITRQEAAVMAARAAKLCGMDTTLNDTVIRDILAQFGDYRVAASWAQNSLAFCYLEGILDDSALHIQPAAQIKRGEIAEMLYRLLGKANLL